MKIIIALLIFGIVIAIHELGHFCVAKKNEITVHEFAVGMGPAIYKKIKDGTQYSIRIIPIGGYVAMEGEDEDSDDPNAFCNKKPLQRMAVIFAGPFMNFVLATLVFMLIFFIYGIPVNKVGGLVPDSPAVKMDLHADDEIISINGKEVKQWRQIPEIIAAEQSKLDIDVIRDGKQIKISGESENIQGRNAIGIYPKYEFKPLLSVKYAFVQTFDLTLQMLDFISKLFTGKLDMKYISGPVGIVKQISSSVGQGFGIILNYIAFISLNLGIMNLLPIPALDGFRFLTAFFEYVTGKKPSKRAEYVVNMAGMIFLIGIMLLITYKDVLNIGIQLK